MSGRAARARAVAPDSCRPARLSTMSECIAVPCRHAAAPRPANGSVCYCISGISCAVGSVRCSLDSFLIGSRVVTQC